MKTTDLFKSAAIAAFAAGSLLGGYDFAAEKSGSGVSIATGYAAGRAAAEEVA